MTSYLNQGWTFHEEADRARKQHSNLVAYSELEENGKLKARAQILQYAEFLKGTRYHIEPIVNQK